MLTCTRDARDRVPEHSTSARDTEELVERAGYLGDVRRMVPSPFHHRVVRRPPLVDRPI